MLVISESSISCGAAALAGKERDTLRLTWEERRWTRKRIVTTAGRKNEASILIPVQNQ